MFVTNSQKQFVKLDPSVKGFGWRWTWNRDEATEFSSWLDAARIGKGTIVDKYGVILTKMRAWREDRL